MVTFIPEVSLVIPVHNGEKTIAQAIEACLNQDYPKEKIEIIVVDDGSTDNTAKVIKKYPVQYFYQKNSGPARARNTGWKNAKGEIISFTDADCIPPKNWVSRLVPEYASGEISGVGGSYEILNPKNLLASCIQEEIITRHLRIPRETNYLGSFNLSLRKNVLEKVGGFDESFKMATSEDRELSYRIIKSGGKLFFNREIKVFHPHPTNLWKYLRQQFWRIFWEVKVYARYPQMPTKDRYIFFTEYFQLPLFLGIIFFSLGILFFPFFGKLILVLISLSILLQFPLVFSIIKRTQKIKYLTLIPINFFRSFAWVIGGITGLIVLILQKKIDEKNRIEKN